MTPSRPTSSRLVTGADDCARPVSPSLREGGQLSAVRGRLALRLEFFKGGRARGGVRIPELADQVVALDPIWAPPFEGRGACPAGAGFASHRVDVMGEPKSIDALGPRDRNAGVRDQVDHRSGAGPQMGDERGVRPAAMSWGCAANLGGVSQRQDLGTWIPGGAHDSANGAKAAGLLELPNLELAAKAEQRRRRPPRQVAFKP